MNYALNRSTDATSEPITLEEAKLHLRVTDSADDDAISAMIVAARNLAEQHTNRQLLTATWDLYLKHFPYSACPIELPRSPIQSITSITYTDPDGASQTWNSSNYGMDVYSEPGRVYLAYSIVWPSTRYIENAVRVRYVAGWTSAALVPAPIKQAILMMIGHWYGNRSAVLVGSISKELEFAWNGLLEPYRVGDEFTCYSPASYDTA